MNFSAMQSQIPELTVTDPRISIGRFTYGKPQWMLWNANERISIGSFCSLANECTIFGGGEHRSDWVTTFPLRIAFGDPMAGKDGHPTSKGETRIGNDVYIGYRAMILSGVTIRDGAVIGAGAVVTKDVPPYAVVAGVPAKVVKMRFSDEIIERLLKLRWWEWELEKIKENMSMLCSSNIEGFLAEVEQ